MPEDLPKAVMILIWLLSGTIIFGWLLMEYSTPYSFIFALIFFVVPVIVYQKLKKSKPEQQDN
jgi:membrane protein implicated in regulation of membrane protease activity